MATLELFFFIFSWYHYFWHAWSVHAWQVRSNNIGVVGFLGDNRRMNVAVTRAQKHVTIVCDSSTVSRNVFLQRLLQHIRQFGEVRCAQQVDKSPSLPPTSRKKTPFANSGSLWPWIVKPSVAAFPPQHLLIRSFGLRVFLTSNLYSSLFTSAAGKLQQSLQELGCWIVFYSFECLTKDSTPSDGLPSKQGDWSPSNAHSWLLLKSICSCV